MGHGGIIKHDPMLTRVINLGNGHIGVIKHGPMLTRVINLGNGHIQSPIRR